jgi:hypothetical protein
MLAAASQDEKKGLKSNDDSTKTLLICSLPCKSLELDVERRARRIAQVQSKLRVRRSASM